MIIDDKSIFLYGETNEGAPLVIVNTFDGDEHELNELLAGMVDIPYTLAVISDVNWNDEMTPWDCQPLFKGDKPCTGGADDYIKKLEDDIVPAIIEKLKAKPAYITIAGYSLGGLFAIYSLYHTSIFTCAVSASGSMWFPDFIKYATSNNLAVMPKRVYFSVGDKEAQTKNAIFKTVEDNTRLLCKHFAKLGIEDTFELNEGNHFKDADLRLAKGIAWVLQRPL